MQVNLKLNTERLKTRINQAFDKTANRFSEEQKERLTDWRWDWHRQTVRRNGQIVGSPRDIVDTGKLLNSLEISKQNEADKVTYTYNYNVDYATIVHEGTGKNPARPWVTTTIQEFDILEDFKQNLREAIK